MLSWTCGGTSTSRDRPAFSRMSAAYVQVRQPRPSIPVAGRLGSVLSCAASYSSCSVFLMVSFSFQPRSPAELVAHRDRVGRHAKAVVAGIADIKTRTQAAPNTMHAEVRSRVRLYSHVLVM